MVLLFFKQVLSLLFLWPLAQSLNSVGAVGSVLSKNKLTAVTVRSDFQKRVVDFTPKLHCDHHYAHYASVSNGKSTQSAKTSMRYKMPALVLEDIEFHVESIQCSESGIIIQFNHEQPFLNAREEWNSLKNFLIISSHPKCNRDGERAPYLVSDVAFRREELSIHFSVRKIEWTEAYDSMTVKFGISQGQHKLEDFRLQSNLNRRQASTSSATVSDINSATATVSFPVASGTPTANSSTLGISYTAPDNQQIFSYSNTIDNVQNTVTMTCKNCSTSGIVEITQGEFTVSTSTTEAGKALDFLNNGYFTVTANGMGAHIELDTSLSLSLGGNVFDAVLATIALPGFQIPGIAAVGPMFQPHVIGSIQITGEMDFTYGFDLTVPNNSSVTLNIGNASQSTTSGFDKAEISPIPLTASSPKISLQLGLGLQAQVLLGVDILSGSGSIQTGAFLDLPYLSVTIAELSGVNAECEPITGSDDLNDFLSHVYPNLTHVVPSVMIDAGVVVGADLNVADIHTSIGVKTTIMGTPIASLPTACLSWDADKNVLASVTSSSTSSAASSSATGDSASNSKSGKSNAGTRGKQNLFSEAFGKWWTAGTMLLGVFLIALSL